MDKAISDIVESYLKASEVYKHLKGHETTKVDTLEGFPLSRAVLLWWRRVKGRLLVILPTEEAARSLMQDLGDEESGRIIHFPVSGKQLYAPYSATAAEAVQSKTIDAMDDLKEGIIVTSIRAFASPVIARSSLERFTRRIRLHDRFDPTALAEKLSRAGYYKSSSCYEVGTFALKGEIMEIFPFSSEEPVRIQADWDEIVRISYYDPQTQQAGRTVSNITLSLVDESSQVETSSFLSYMKGDEYLFFVGHERSQTSWKALCSEARELFKKAYAEKDDVPVPERLLTDPFAYLESRSAKTIVYDIRSDQSHHFDIGAGRSFFGNVTLFKEDLEGMLENGWSVHVVVPSLVQQQRMENILVDYPGVDITIGDMSHGFSIDDRKLFVVLDQEIFNRRTVRRQAVVKVESQAIDSFVDLKEGDYVVHVNYGIGQFVRIERAKTSRAERDYIKIRYANDEYLYVPIEQADLVQRYIGNDGRAPKLDSMGGSGWTKKKERAVKKAQELAGQLIRLYAQRQNSFGFPFEPDNDWQIQFEASFPFTETPDQLKCVDDIKHDMESDKVMDRLVCGDVGYGKTEIAFRAAFKAVMSGRQVAFLAPTTILAEQHWRTRQGGCPFRNAQDPSEERGLQEPRPADSGRGAALRRQG